ncbi:MAG: phospho-N-acetylmuramoyl-pentapeptide-transferase, partial [Muribaculaceae bacterium]|nr:phospho-N-acetylmuramoyl-pentapeptide-transferase [Muribaculaceae bacterium]
MFYYLFNWLNDYNIPGSRLFDYVTFRSGAAFVLAMLLAIFFGRRIIERLQLMQVGEIIRDLGLEGQMKKTGTPTMGGIIIIMSIVIPCLLVSNLGNPYMLLMLVATLWLGTIGFLDDYKKIKKHNKEGMKGKYKIIGQIGIGVIVATTMYLNPDMVTVANHEVVNDETNRVEEVIYETDVQKAPVTTIPFVKNNNFDYSSLTSWMGENGAETGGWIFFLVVTIFFVAATSNGANLTDGLDGLATGCSAIIGLALVIMAYLGGNVIYS